MQSISDVDLIFRIAGSQSEGRSIIAIAGPPGSGKSTFAEKLDAELNAISAGSSAILPMDGFHFDDMVLVPRGLRPRKGAPETFDVAGFAHMIGRLRDNLEPEVAVPVFDRSIEIARAGARTIPRTVRTVIVEGNYLLLDRSPWNELKFDLTVMVEFDREVLRQRLLQRWLDLGMDLLEASSKVKDNDMINADLVKASSRSPHFSLRTP
ncbi:MULTISPECIES: nucleoside/nucleotide kinase family protein [Rhizobium]|uniref:Nucleoside/nucleotide kinase family protein n=1 Tax=Rhizobium laguerreae TaxID=1076926 RepID=A0A7Y2W891_9HYPH|nr:MULTISPECIES: nucleoside/nucleotide kinase family protein [Rhizobium]MBY5454565.1 nucleoside/nucleotide kinase family protein [Rhizobium leguminosarum]NNH42006.1 nucleoside/nucleotide kinase family protein [Rhizobium laguerreae]NNH57216.1 nucleoside/nucleotide kinase family protein [Rhizobium laguerreae]NNH67206.1 nucleoside/nucleotide kinase family protein [Rhizobium laguerreae]